MIKFLRYTLILTAPFLIMVIINEAVRSIIKEKPYKVHGVTAINSAEYLPNKCTWICHNNTTYCKSHHVKYLKPYYSITDLYYFGAIDILASTGNYGAANIIFLVFIFPLTILYFIIKSIDIQEDIQKLPNHKL
ncbi:MAG: hypothetical protein U0V72_11585 [Cytophagales bacterium]